MQHVWALRGSIENSQPHYRLFNVHGGGQVGNVPGGFFDVSSAMAAVLGAASAHTPPLHITSMVAFGNELIIVMTPT